MTGEDAVELPVGSTDCVQDCQAQDRVRGSLPVIDPASQDSDDDSLVDLGAAGEAEDDGVGLGRRVGAGTRGPAAPLGLPRPPARP